MTALLLPRVTVLMNTPVVAFWVGVIVLFFVWKKWYTEALLLTGSLVTTGLLVVILKHIYLRPRPALSTFGPRRGLFFSKWPLLGSHPGLR